MTAGDDRRIVAFDLKQRRVSRRIHGPESSVIVLRFSRDGRYVASATFGGWIHLIDARTWRLLLRFSAHGESIFNLAFSPDGKVLASSSYLRTRIWPLVEAFDRRPIAELLPEAERNLAVRPNGFDPSMKTSWPGQ